MKWRVFFCVLSFLAGLAAGLAGDRRKSMKVDESRWESAGVVRDTIESVREVRVEVPREVVVPVRRDTVYRDSVRYVTERVDTAAILADYVLKRYYEETLFDSDTLGLLRISLSGQYNRLSGLAWEYRPVRLVRTVERERLWLPFVVVSADTRGAFGAGAGVFYRQKLGVSLRAVSSSRVLTGGGLEMGVLWGF